MEALRNGVLYSLLAVIGVMIASSVLAAAYRAVSLMMRRPRHDAPTARAQ